MTKSDLIDVLCETQKMPKGRAELLVNVIFDSMEAALRRGERIEIRGLGSFEIRNYRAYEGRNPRTGAAVSVKPKRLPFFKVGKELKERVNQGARRPPVKAPAPAASTSAAAPAGANGDGVPATATQENTGPVASTATQNSSAPAPSGNGTSRATA